MNPNTSDIRAQYIGKAQRLLATSETTLLSKATTTYNQSNPNLKMSTHSTSSTNSSLDNIHENTINSTSSASNLYNFVDPNKVHLFVKAGQDTRSQGACPFCQDVFMQLLIKAEENKFNFDVITINLDNPPKEFKELCIKPPVLFHSANDIKNMAAASTSTYSEIPGAIVLSDVDEIADHLDNLYPNRPLVIFNEEAKKSFLNVFSKFSHFIRDVSTQQSLEAELEKINNYLKKCQLNENKKFLCGNYLTKLDCALLPRLQHIRVASEAIKRYKIPEKFTHLWTYLDNAYQTEAFQKSCPPDREIIWHWSKSNASGKDLLQIIQETPYKTMQVPNNK